MFYGKMANRKSNNREAGYINNNVRLINFEELNGYLICISV
jgi:hypothetical protein